ncbi:MAG TPA: hypothetical protein VFG47_11005 [Geminicoccaceae bacterium]|nr:hypothetical protein [Geminicoccaceae bacterium]
MARSVPLLALWLALLAAPAGAADLALGYEAYLRGDFKTAARSFGDLAGRGVPEAQFMLGRMYAAGQGFERDPVRAYSWLTLAGDAGQHGALRRRRELARRMTPEQVAEGAALAATLARAGEEGDGGPDAAGAPPSATPPR